MNFQRVNINTVMFAIAMTFAAGVLCVSQSANATVYVHGSTTAYQETGGDWLTKGTNDIDGSGGLGSDGYIFYGLFDNPPSQNGQPYGDNTALLPSYVTSHGPGANFASVAYGFTPYGQIDDPTVLDGTNKQGGIALATGGGAGATREIMTFNISGLDSNQIARVGVLGGIESNNDGRHDPTSITLSDGSSSATVGNHATSKLAANPGGTNTGWVFFDVNADGAYAVSGTKRLANQGTTSIGGLTFDSITVPVIAAYDFSGTDPSATLVDPNATGSNWSSGSGMSEFFAAGEGDTTGLDADGRAIFSNSKGSMISSRGLGATSGSETAAFANNDFFTVTVTPDDDFGMSLTSFTFEASRRNVNRANDEWTLTSSIDGHSVANAIATGTINVTDPNTYQRFVVDLSGDQFKGIQSATEFRIYLYGAAGGSNGGTLTTFDNIVINGTVNPIPEPSSLILASLGASGLVFRRRRKYAMS